jgi:hypothetical protein
MIVAAVLVALFAIVLPLANNAVWLASTAVSEDRFVDTFGPLPQDPAVAAALGQALAASIVENNDIEARIDGRLPDNLSFLAAPVTVAIETVMARAATDVISTDGFDTVWTTTLRAAHKAALVVVNGTENGVLVSEDGVISLDLSPIIEELNTRLMAKGIDVLDRVDLDNFDTTIDIYETRNSGLVQGIANLIYAIRWVAIAAVVLLLLGAVLFATDKRRVTLWLGVATIVSAFLMFIEGRLLRSNTIETITDPTYKEGAESAWSIIFNQLSAQTWALLLIGIFVTTAAWLVGPSQGAASVRHAFTGRRDSSRDDNETPSEVPIFIARHLRLLEWLTLIIAVLVLMVVPTLSGWMVLVATGLVVAVIGGLEWVGGGASSDRDSVTTSSE